MAAFEFKFSQTELQELVTRTDKNKLSITFCGLDGYNGKRTFYLCALSLAADGTVDEGVRPIIGCPFPPEWKDKIDTIPHKSLEMAPKFTIKASLLAGRLAENTHVPSSANEVLLTALLDAKISPSKKEIGKNELQTFVSFIMKDTNGVQVGLPVDSELP